MVELSEIVGTSGFVVEAIEKFLPGGTSTIVVACVWLFIMFVIRGKSFSESPREVGGYGLGVVSGIFILTGNFFYVILVVILMGGIQISERSSVYNVSFGTRAERSAIKGAGYPYAAQKKAALRAMVMKGEKLGTEKLGKAATRAERALAEESERDVELELHEEAITACALNIRKSVTDLQNREISVEKRNKIILESVTVIDKQLINMDNRLAINDAGYAYVKMFAVKLGKLLGELVNDKKYEENFRKLSLDNFQQNVRTIGTAVQEAMKVERRALFVEKKLESLSFEEIKQVKKVISKKKKKEKKLTNDIKKISKSKKNKAARNAMKDQLKAVVEELANLELEKEKLDDMHDQLKSVLKKLKKTLRKLRRDLKHLKGSSEESNKHQDEMYKFINVFHTAIKDMQISHQEFVGEIHSLDTTSPEEVAIKTTKDVAEIYTGLIKTAEETMKFNSDKMRPFVKSMIKTISEAEEVARSSYYLNFFQVKLEEAFESLNKLAISVADGKKVKKKLSVDLDDQKIQEGLARYMTKVGSQTLAIMQASVKNLIASEVKIVEHEKILRQEIVAAEVEEKVTLAALTRVTKVIMNHKKDAHAGFMDDAKEYSKKLKKAKKDAMAARSAA